VIKKYITQRIKILFENIFRNYNIITIFFVITAYRTIIFLTFFLLRALYQKDRTLQIISLFFLTKCHGYESIDLHAYLIVSYLIRLFVIAFVIVIEMNFQKATKDNLRNIQECI